MRKTSELLLVAASLLAGLTLSPTGTAAQSVPITISAGNRAAVRVCAEALVDALRGDNVASSIKVVSHDELQKMRDAGALDDRVPHAVIDLELRDEISLTATPFAFRDAPHFLAYLQSNLFERIGTRLYDDQIALAYAGFSQLFSKVAAITEPKHFNGRTVSGDTRALLVYHAFGAQPGLNILAGFAVPDTAELTGYFERMGQGHAMANIVEAPLAEVPLEVVARNARYLSLTSSTLMTISMRTSMRDEFVDRGTLARSAQTAAMNCSRANYQTELDAVERLKTAGIKVAPFNRPALVEASWRMALEESHDYWTIAEFDALEQLDGGFKGVPLPSAIVAKMAPAKRRAALKLDEQARKNLAP
jgi:hypothetical protein